MEKWRSRLKKIPFPLSWATFFLRKMKTELQGHRFPRHPGNEILPSPEKSCQTTLDSVVFLNFFG